MSTDNHVVLAALGQVNRKPQFCIITKIIRTPSGLISTKEAHNKNAIPHIKQVYDNYQLLKKHLPDTPHYILTQPKKLNNQTISFDYIAGDNAEQAIFDAIINNKDLFALEILERIFTLVDSFSDKRDRKTPANHPLSAVKDIYSSKKNIYPGIIDLNADNFIIHNDKLYLIDYEWVFKTPIPVDFIKTRILHYLFSRYSDAFAFLPNQKRPFRKITFNHSSLYIPETIYSNYKFLLSKKALLQFSKVEQIFQQYVAEMTSSESQKKYQYDLTTVTSSQLTSFDIYDNLRTEYERILSDNIELEKEKVRISEELNAIKTSKSWKAIQQGRSIKDKIIRPKE